MRVLRKWLLLLSLAFAPLPALGQSNCGDFIDVSPTDFFCQNVEWIANRLVTLGCTATEYCPNNFVLRSQMAAFLNRLGTALTPTILRTIEAPPANSTYDPSIILCASPAQLPITDFPRQASFAATLMNFTASATKTIQGQLVYSTDNGANWLPTGDAVMWQTVDPLERTTLALVGGPLNLGVGSSYLFAIRGTTNNPIATVFSECQLNVRIENRNGTSTPF
jgi:hypothetical protein